MESCLEGHYLSVTADSRIRTVKVPLTLLMYIERIFMIRSTFKSVIPEISSTNMSVEHTLEVGVTLASPAMPEELSVKEIK